MKFGKLFLTMVVPGILAVPALADEHVDDFADEKVCINSNLVRNFDGLDDQHVFVEERSKNYYLLTMRLRCNGLRHAEAIGFKDATSRICSSGFGEVVFRERGIGPTSCRIATIERVENKDDARAIIAERKQWEKDKKEMEKAEKKKQKEMKKAMEDAAQE